MTPLRTIVVSVAASLVILTGAAASGLAFSQESNGLKWESVLGKPVTTEDDGVPGRIIDVLANNNGQIRAAVIEFGGFLGIGTRKVVVDWSALRFVDDGSGTAIRVGLTPDQMRLAPVYSSAPKFESVGPE